MLGTSVGETRSPGERSLPDRQPLAIAPRGLFSKTLLEALVVPPNPTGERQLKDLYPAVENRIKTAEDICGDGDIQLSLFLLYGIYYGSIPQIDSEWEWNPHAIEIRRLIEDAFEEELRSKITISEPPPPQRQEVADWLFRATAPTPGPSLARHIAKSATEEQLREFLVHRSIYTLREADPHAWAIPRLTGEPKAALVEIQADEYGGGDPVRMHSAIFAQTMRGLGLDDVYGQYVNDVSALTLASQNMMSMFGLNRRLLGAIVGHLAAFEMTSSIPNRLYGDGFRRLGYGEDVTWYFDEHVEADAVHEQIAGRDLAGVLAEQHPELLNDILFGAMACLTVDDWVAQEILDAWQRGESSLYVAAG